MPPSGYLMSKNPDWVELKKNVTKPFAESVLIPLELTAVASAKRIHKKILGSGIPTFIISNEETKDIM